VLARLRAWDDGATLDSTVPVLSQSPSIRRPRRFRCGLAGLAALTSLALASGPAQAQNPLNPPSHAGFPYTIPGAGTVLTSQPVIADLGLTPGFAQIIFGTMSGLLYVLQHNPNGTWSPAPGWPRQLPSHISSSPAIGDLDGDGIPEIVVGYGSTYFHNLQGGAAAFKRDGTLMWQFLTAANLGWTHAPVVGTPAIGDVDGDGKAEVAFGSFDQQIYLLDGATGQTKPGWPVNAWDTVYSSATLYDIDGDGLPDIIIGTDATAQGPPANTPNGGCLRVLRYDGTYVTGFPKCIDQVIASSPVVADIDGDGRPEIIFGTGTFWGSNGNPGNPAHVVYAWHCDGTPVAGWPVAVDGQVHTTPAIADLNGDGHLEVIVTDDNSGPSGTFHLYVFKGDGTLLWSAQPKDFTGNTLSLSEPVVADVLGDSHLEVLVPTNSEAAVFDHNGNQLTQGGPPYTNQKISFNTPTALWGVAVGDLETDHADGKIEVVAVSGTPWPNPTDVVVNVWNPVASDNPPPWGMFRRSSDRNGIFPGAGSCSGACTVSSGPTHFFTLSPCRVVDTRQANGAYGGPPLANGVQRNFVMPNQCGIPSGAAAISANVTVVSGTGDGFITIGPGCIVPTVSTIDWRAGQTRANNAILALDAAGRISVSPSVAGTGTVQFVLDVNGYFH
jgi:hypothetical protein